MIFRTAALVSLFAISASAQIEAGCSICGEGLKVGFPDAVFIFPEQPAVACGILEAAGLNGVIPLNECALLPELVEGLCECELAVNPTDAPFAPAMTPTSPGVTVAPVTMAPAAVTGAPVTKAPAASVTMAPVTMAPVTMAPVTMAPVTMAPVTMAPVTMTPVTAGPSGSMAPSASPTDPGSGATHMGMCIATLVGVVAFFM
jgi:hypothetical protein